MAECNYSDYCVSYHVSTGHQPVSLFGGIGLMWGKRRMFDIHSLERFVNSANLAYLVFAALTLLATLAVVLGTSRLAKMKEADANTRMELAKRDAAQANQRGAEAVERVKLLENENLKLRTEHEAAIAESRHSQGKLKSEQTKLACAHKELAQAEQKRAESQLVLEKTLEAVRERQTPRTLTARQRGRLISLLRDANKGELVLRCPMGDGEAIAYAHEFEGLLKTANWPTSAGGIEHAIFHGSIPGVFVVVRNAENAPQYAADLIQALTNIGVEVRPVEDPDSTAEVVLCVGQKP